MDSKLKIVVGEVQHKITSIPTRNTNIERNVKYPDILLVHISAFYNCDISIEKG